LFLRAHPAQADLDHVGSSSFLLLEYPIARGAWEIFGPL